MEKDEVPIKEKVKQLVWLGVFWSFVAPGLAVAWIRYVRDTAKKRKEGD